MEGYEPFNLNTFKAAWRARVEEIKQSSAGKTVIDPVEGINSFQLSNRAASAAKALHARDASLRLIAHARKHPLQFDNGHGEIDPERVRDRASRTWWVRSHLWVYGEMDEPPRSAERLAVRVLFEKSKVIESSQRENKKTTLTGVRESRSHRI